MANGKKTFIFYSDWINMVREMPNEDAGELLKHILSYVNDEDPTTENILVKMAFGHMKPMLKKDLDKWDEIRKIRKKAGAKGGKANAKQKQANAKQVEAVNDNVNVINKDLPKGKYTTYHFKQTFLELGVKESHLRDWIKVRKDKRASNTETSANQIINECQKHNYKVSDAIKKCAEESWSGFKYEWIKNQKPKTNHLLDKTGAL